MLTLLEKIGLHQNCLRTRHFADYSIQPTLIWFPLLATAFIVGQDYLASGHTTHCDPQTNDSLRTAEYVNSYCGSTLEDINQETFQLNAKHIPMLLICQAVILQLLHLAWDWVASETLLLDLQSFVSYSNDIAQSLEAWYTSIWSESPENCQSSEDSLDFDKANIKFLQAQLLVKMAKGWLIDWLVYKADSLYQRCLIYSVLVCIVALIIGVLTLTFAVHNGGESAFHCQTRGIVYDCIYRNGYLVYAVSIANCVSCAWVIFYLVYFNLRVNANTQVSTLFFPKNIPGMSSIDFKDALTQVSDVDCRKQGLKLFSLYMDHNKFFVKQFSYLRRYAKLCEDKDIPSLKNTYLKYIHHVHKIRYICATDCHISWPKKNKRGSVKLFACTPPAPV